MGSRVCVAEQGNGSRVWRVAIVMVVVAVCGPQSECASLSLADCLSGSFFWSVMVVMITAEFCLARSVFSRL